ncbi:MAG TPA: NADH:flavin oxidoreductase/NADH oxidase [Bryobacteraceae bacterium]|nr:NADH:flavin oxidoreductase/NADH oxidase [Bryobacteraceae bacterium]
MSAPDTGSAAATAELFTPLPMRSITLRNRIGVSPMCQYACEDGFATEWHLVHLGSRAVGGAGLVMVEATGVEHRGLISPFDMGIYKDDHVTPLARIANFVMSQGAVAGIQLAHAGRKASTRRPWEGGQAIPADEGGWQTVAPSPVPFRPEDPPPAGLSLSGIREVIDSFAAAARRAVRAGFQVIEIHAAHGYLLHQFLSPLSNFRRDEYGGPFEHRIRLLLEVAAAVRSEWPAHLPLFIRISATDWVEGGWTIEDSVELARRLKPAGVDLVDCSSGGSSLQARIPLAPGYQVPFAARIRQQTGLCTAAVGLITSPAQANEVVRSGSADLVLLAREFLRDPYFPLHAAKTLGAPVPVPVRYGRGFA